MIHVNLYATLWRYWYDPMGGETFGILSVVLVMTANLMSHLYLMPDLSCFVVYGQMYYEGDHFFQFRYVAKLFFTACT